MEITRSLWLVVLLLLLLNCAAWEHLSFSPDNFLCKEYDSFCNTFLDRVSCTTRTVTACINNSLASYVGICTCSEPFVFDYSGSAIGKNLFDNRIKPDVGWNMLPWTGPPYNIGDSYSAICTLTLRRLGCPYDDIYVNAVKEYNSSTGKLIKDFQCTCGTFTIASARVNDAIIGNVVASEMALTPIFDDPVTLSIELSLGLVFVVGKLGATIATMLYLPHILGYMFAGMAFQNVINSGVMKGCATGGPGATPQGEMKILVLIIVLMRAGLGLDVKKLYEKGVLTMTLACIPYFCEFIVEMMMAAYIFNISYTDAGLYASIIAALSPSLVIPGMIKMVSENLGGSPKQVLAAAPLEVVIAVILYNVFVSLAESNGNPLYPWVRILPLWANIILIPVNIVFSSVIGFVIGWCLSKWYWFRTAESSITDASDQKALQHYHKVRAHIARATGSSTAEFLFIYLVAGYVLYALCTVQYIQQSSGVLAVFATSLTIAELAPLAVVNDMKHALAGLWVFAEVALFTFVGAGLSFNTSNGPLQSNRGINASKVNEFCSIMFVGTAARLFGIIASYCSCFKYLPKHKQSLKYFWPLILFAYLSTIAKATVQATLGGLPLQYQLIPGINGIRTAVTIQQGAGFAILIMAPIGILLTQVVARPLAAYLADLDRKAGYLVDFDETFEKVLDPVFLSPVEVLAEETAEIVARKMMEVDEDNSTFVDRARRNSYSVLGVSVDADDYEDGVKMVEMGHHAVSGSVEGTTDATEDAVDAKDGTGLGGSQQQQNDVATDSTESSAV